MQKVWFCFCKKNQFTKTMEKANDFIVLFCMQQRQQGKISWPSYIWKFSVRTLYTPHGSLRSQRIIKIFFLCPKCRTEYLHNFRNTCECIHRYRCWLHHRLMIHHLNLWTTTPWRFKRKDSFHYHYYQRISYYMLI